jgi:phenylacetate-CoA ligase
MPVKRPAAGELEQIETAKPKELAALQLERLRWSLAHAYEHVPHYRRKFDAARVAPADLKTLADLAKFPFTTKRICATTIRSGCSRCRASRSCASTRRRERRASRPSSATRRRTSTRGRR